MLVSIAFNLAVDPFATNRWLNINGFNSNKPDLETRQRLLKTFEVYRAEPSAVFLGSSRTDIGLNIANARWGDDPVYNLGIAGAGVDEVKQFLWHAKAQGRLKKAIIGLDFFMFNADYIHEGLTGFDHSILTYPGDPNPLRELFSMLTIAMSRDTFNASVAISINSLKRDTGTQYLSPKKTSKNHRHDILKHAVNYLNTIYLPYKTGRFTFSNKSRGDMFEHFRQIVRFCYQHNIETRIFISPSHAWQWELIDVAGLWPQFEYWKKTIVAIVEEEATQQSRPPFMLWDFSGYNSVTTEAVPACESHDIMTGYRDSSHYQPAVGRLVLKRLLDQASREVPDDFGVLVSTQNINQHLSLIQRDRERWRSSHPADQDEIRVLARRVFAKESITYDYVCPKTALK